MDVTTSESVQGHMGCGHVEQPGLMGAGGRGLEIVFLLKVTLHESNKICWATFSFLNY